MPPLTPPPELPRATPWPQAAPSPSARPAGSRGPPRPPSPSPSTPPSARSSPPPSPPSPTCRPSTPPRWTAGPSPAPGPGACARPEGSSPGTREPEPLPDGDAVRIATGARIPHDATAVLRSEHGRTDDQGRLHATRDVEPRPGHPAARPGVPLRRPAAAHRHLRDPGRARARGGRRVRHPRRGPPAPGRSPRPGRRVAHRGAAARRSDPRRARPDAAALAALARRRRHRRTQARGRRRGALRGAEQLPRRRSSSPPAAPPPGPVDHVHPTLRRLGAELLVRRRRRYAPATPCCWPGSRRRTSTSSGCPATRWPPSPGCSPSPSPCCGPSRAGRRPEPYTLPLKDEVHGHPHDTRLVPVVLRGDRAVPLHYNGPAMLRGIAAAEALAVVPPGGARAGQELELLDLPWAAATEPGSVSRETFGWAGAERSASGQRRMFHVKLPGHDAIARQADEHLVTHRVKLPRTVVERPLRQVAKRVAMALLVLVGTVLIVYADRDGYNDNADGSVDLPRRRLLRHRHPLHHRIRRHRPVSDAARLTNIFLITPLRVLFLIILVGTTLEVLTERTREEWRLNRWRASLARSHRCRRLRHQGPLGRADRLCHRAEEGTGRGRRPQRQGGRGGHRRGVRGRGRRRHPQRRAAAGRGAEGAADHHRHPARRHRRAGHPDGPAAQPQARRSWPPCARRRTRRCCKQSGADAVITSASAAGRLLGLSVLSPSAGMVMEDLIQQGSGLDIVERPVIKAEVGKGAARDRRPGRERRTRASGAGLRRSVDRAAPGGRPADHHRAGDAGRACGARRPPVP